MGGCSLCQDAHLWVSDQQPAEKEIQIDLATESGEGWCIIKSFKTAHKRVVTKLRASKREVLTEQIHQIISDHSYFIYSRTQTFFCCWFTEGFLNTNLLTDHRAPHKQTPTRACATTRHICTVSTEAASRVSTRLTFTFTFFWAKSVFSSCFFFFSIKWFSFFCC